MDQQQPNDPCNVARLALGRIDGRDVATSLDNLSQAYKHSRTCDVCGEVLGEFITDVIKMLGVRLPRVQRGATDLPQYEGTAAEDRTSEVSGPGSIMWDPKQAEAGYKIKKTLSSMALTVEELETKCRLKDHLIEKMADELKNLSHCANWSGTDLLAEVGTSQPAPSIDFDRAALCNYLYLKPQNSLETEESDYLASNPLGLTVVRQVGADSLLIQWKAPPPNKVNSYEIFVNGLFVQRIRTPGRNKALIHPVDLENRVYITLNALTYKGEPCEAVTINYP